VASNPAKNLMGRELCLLSIDLPELAEADRQRIADLLRT
jgi:hypothetical protein